MILKLIFVWLAIQLPLGALIGTLIENGMVEPRRREPAQPAVPEPERWCGATAAADAL
jgi:hypothetical protein